MSRNTIGKQLQEERKHRSFSQADIANQLKCDRAAISRIENGKYQGSLQLFERYLNLLGLELSATPLQSKRPIFGDMTGVYDDD